MRPPLTIGTHGKIGYSRLSPEGVVPETWRAYANYRGKDGKTWKPERRATAPDTKRAQRAAKAKLEQFIRELNGSNVVKLAKNTRLHVAVEAYLVSVKKRRKGTTYDTYRRWANARVIPNLGDLRLSECTAGRIQDYLDALVDEPSTKTGEPLSANSRRAIRKVISGALKLAVRDGAIASNPCSDLEDIDGGARKFARGYDAATAAAFFEAVDTDKVAVRFGHNHLIKFLFLTGARIGEALAVRWCDVNLDDVPITVEHPMFGRWTIPPRSVWFNGNIVRITGQGIVRHDGKTPSSVDLVGMSNSLHTMLTVLKPAGANPEDPIFPSTKGTHRCPGTTQTIVARLRERVGFPEFTTHYGRRSHGTALDAAGQTARQVADALRKTSVPDTQKSYMVRGLSNPAAPAAIDGFFGR